MRKRYLFACGMICLSFLAVSSRAEDPQAFKAGDLVPASFRAFLVTDGRFQPIKTPDGKEVVDPRNRTGKIHCLICENGLAPVIAVFVRADPSTLPPDKGVAELIKRANDMLKLPRFRADKLATFVVFLSLKVDPVKDNKAVKVKTVKEDKSEVEETVQADIEFPDEDLEKRTVAVEAIKSFTMPLNSPSVPIGLAADKSKSLAQWRIGEKDVTVIAYYRMRIVKEWEFNKAEDLKTDNVTEILKTIEDAISGSKK